MEIIKSEKIGEIAAALAKAQGAFAPCKRTAVNPFFKSKYAPLDEVVAATQPALTASGLAITQLTHAGEKMELTTLLLHSSGEYIGSTYPINPTKPDPQGIMAALTYARRGALMAILGVPTEDDDGNAASSAPLPKVAAPAKPAAPTPAAPTAATDEPPAKPTRPVDKDGNPVDLNEYECEVGTIEQVSTNKGPKSTRYGVKVGGKWHNTFSATLGKYAAANKGAFATAYYTAKEYKGEPTRDLEYLEIDAEPETEVANG